MIRMSVVVIAAGLLALPAFGQTPAAPSTSPGENRSTGGVTIQPGPVMNEDEIKEQLRREGYTEITELVLQGPSYEAKALKDGRRFNLTVDARTGAIRSRY
jgi:hypothetical protein